MQLWELFLSAFISSTIAPGGSEVLIAYLAAKKTASITDLLTVATLGNTLGAMTTWGLGWLAEKKYPFDSLALSKQKALNTLRAKGLWVLLLSWLPVVGDAFCFAAGWLKLPIYWGICLIILGKFCRYLVIVWVFI